MTVNYMYFCSEMEGQKGFRELRKIIYFTLIPASVRNISTQHIGRRYHMQHFLEVFLYSARLCDAKSVVPFPTVFLLVDERVCTKLFPAAAYQHLHSIFQMAFLRLQVFTIVPDGIEMADGRADDEVKSAFTGLCQGRIGLQRSPAM